MYTEINLTLTLSTHLSEHPSVLVLCWLNHGHPLADDLQSNSQGVLFARESIPVTLPFCFLKVRLHGSLILHEKV